MLEELLNKILENKSSFKIPVYRNEKSIEFLKEFEKLSKKEKKDSLKNEAFLLALKGSYVYGAFDFVNELVKSKIYYRNKKLETNIFHLISEFDKEKMNLWALDVYFNGLTMRNMNLFLEMDSKNILKAYYASKLQGEYEHKFKNRELFYKLWVLFAKCAEKDISVKIFLLGSIGKLMPTTIDEILDNIKKEIPQINYSTYCVSPYLSMIDLKNPYEPLKTVFFESLRLTYQYGLKFPLTPESVLKILVGIENTTRNVRVPRLKIEDEHSIKTKNVQTVFKKWLQHEKTTLKEKENIVKLLNTADSQVRNYLEPLENDLLSDIMKGDVENNCPIVKKVKKF